MLLDAGAIFDAQPETFSKAMGTPQSAEYFSTTYIDHAFEESHKSGTEMQAAFWAVVCDYQREGFITGFKAAAQLLMGCMPGGGATGG